MSQNKTKAKTEIKSAQKYVQNKNEHIQKLSQYEIKGGPKNENNPD